MELAINTSVSDSTGKSPAELVFGAPLQMPIDFVVGSHVVNDSARDLAQVVRDLTTHA